MLNDVMSKIFGSNWRTAFWSLVTAICSFVLYYDKALEPLPDYWEELIKQVVAFMAGAGLFKMGLASRDHVVSERAVDKLEKKIEQAGNKSEKF